MSNSASGFRHQPTGGRATMLSFARDKNTAIASSSSFPSQRLPPFLLTDSDACTSGLRSSSSSTAVMATATAGTSTSPCRRVSCHVRLLWTALSVMVTAGCTYSFTQPAWYINGRSRDGLGLYNYCIRDVARSAAAAARFGSSAIR